MPVDSRPTAVMLGADPGGDYPLEHPRVRKTTTYPKEHEGRVLWMRDEAQFSVTHCKMSETVIQTY
jgi:hypothetical protein